MQAHVQLLRKHALDGLPDLFAAVADDPAMYSGLGGEQNRKARPNLVFARSWLESYTIGAEQCDPSTVSELARAWTGWFVYGGKLRFIEREHDHGPKRLLGIEGNLGRDEALRHLAENPATARNVGRRLFRAFVSENASPSDALLEPLAERIARKTSLLEVLEMILRSNLFFSEHAFAQRIKSPVELAIGVLRSLEGPLPTIAVAEDLANLGQRLIAPPTVQGWAGGIEWINTISLAGRIRLCESLLRGSDSYGTGVNPEKIAASNGLVAPDDHKRFLIDLLLPGLFSERTLAQATTADDGSPKSAKALLETIIAQPEFQLN